jgi:hypothetical protein
VLLQITLSQKTKDLLNQVDVLNNNPLEIPPGFQTQSDVALDELIRWINREQNDLDLNSRFLQESLRASLLFDTYHTLAGNQNSEEEPTHWVSNIKMLGLGLAGILYFGCMGAGVLGLGPLNIPIYIFGGLLTIAFIGVFFSSDFLEIMNDLGFNFKRAPKLVDAYAEQINVMKLLRKKLQRSYLDMDKEELARSLLMLDMLKKRSEALELARASVKESVAHPLLNLCKYAVALVVGALFFADGFIAAQGVAFALAGLIVTGVSPMAWPIILASIVVGVAAFALYWYAQHRLGFQNKVVAGWIGSDSEKIALVSNEEAAEKENGKRDILVNNIQAKQAALLENVSLRQKVASLEDENIGLRWMLQRQDCLPTADSSHSVSQAGHPSSFFEERAQAGQRKPTPLPFPQGLQFEDPLCERNGDFSMGN